MIVRSEHGELTGVAKVDASVRRGAVSVPHGHAGANVNRLTSKDDIDLVTGMTRYSGWPSASTRPEISRRDCNYAAEVRVDTCVITGSARFAQSSSSSAATSSGMSMLV